MRESVEIDLGPEHLLALQTIVDPVLVSEIPTVVWSPHGHDEAVDALLPLIDVILLDSDDLDDPPRRSRAPTTLREHAYVVDLAWLRTTPWRERLAATFDLPSGSGRWPDRGGWRSAIARLRPPARCCWPAGSPRGWLGDAAAALGVRRAGGRARRDATARWWWRCARPSRRRPAWPA